MLRENNDIIKYFQFYKKKKLSFDEQNREKNYKDFLYTSFDTKDHKKD